MLSQTLKISNNGGGDGLLNINLNSNDEFGASVSHSDNLIAVGSTGNSIYEGAVHIFEKDSNGIWSKTFEISENGGGTGKLDISLDYYDRFGISVSYSDNTLVVGAYGDDDGSRSRSKGAAYIFEKDLNGDWEQTLKISDNGGGDGKLDINLNDLDELGSSVSYSDNTLVVGVYRDDDGGEERGAVYIFEKDSNGEWSKTLKISDNGGGTGLLDVNLNDYDFFGRSVSHSENQLFVGAYTDDDGGSNRGAVYVFEKDSNGVWSKTLKISDNGGGPGKLGISLDDYDLFGSSISYLDKQLVVGAYGDDDGGSSKGAVYIFEKDSSGVWSKTLKISATLLV